MHPDEVLPALQKSLDDLQLKYLDLYLVHLPVPGKTKKPSSSHLLATVTADSKSVRRLPGFGLQDVYRELEKAHAKGLIKAIGVSNFPVISLNDCLNYAKVPPAVNQIERHPYLVQPQLVKFCHDNNVAVTAYASLGAPGLPRSVAVPLLEDSTIAEVTFLHFSFAKSLDCKEV